LPLISVSDDEDERVPAEVLTWGPAEKHFVVHTSQPENLQLRLFNFPAWEVTVNGRPTVTRKTNVTGLMLISVAAGTSDIHIHFRQTPDHRIGNSASLLCLVLLAIMWIKTRTKSHLGGKSYGST
jgi:hypothetical protein